MKSIVLHNIIFIVLSLLTLQSFSQVTKITGTIYDAKNQEEMPFVNISMQYTTTGTVSDFEGHYALETKIKADSLIISFIGYHPQTIKIEPNRFQKIDIFLERTELQLSEVVINYTGNPADDILKKIIKNKEQNNITTQDYAQYEAYTKIEFDLNNLSEEFKKRRAFRKIDFIFDYIDTSTINNKTYLPVFLSESISNIYLRNNPKSKREHINAIKVSGVESKSIGQFMGDLYQNINIYDNFISLFEKNFVSPISNSGSLFYRYYLIDSNYRENLWHYNIAYKPKRSGDLCFTGNFWVVDSLWAIHEIRMDMAKESNINYINAMFIEQDFLQTKQGFWVLSKEKTIIDFNIFENAKRTAGLFGKKTSSYKNHIFDIEPPPYIFKSPSQSNISADAHNRTPEYWDIVRHEELDRNELTIYHMVDTLTSLPIFNTYIDIIQTIVMGYKVLNKLEIGPYMSFVSFNQVEGPRLRLGGRTSNAFSTKLMLNGHLAYGFSDQALKYGAGFLYLFNKNPRTGISASIKHDMEQIGQSQNAFREDFLLAALFRRSPANKLSMVDEYKAKYEHEWFQGFSTNLSFTHRNVFPVENTKFIVNQKDQSYEKRYITTSEVGMDIRFAYKESFLMGEFERVSAGTKYPILELKYAYGVPELFGSDYTYHRVLFNIKQWFNIGAFGWSKYHLEAGKIFGKLPYPLLKLHEGNETWFFDEYSFNIMNYYEFVSDQYVSLTWTHHFDGFFLNRIPLFKRLKWREVAYFKGLIGNIEDRNLQYSEFPANLNKLSKPYFESGVGVENIFNIIRVDAVWRLSHTDNKKASKFGILGSLQFMF